jgi:hypothetical protein
LANIWNTINAGLCEASEDLEYYQKSLMLASVLHEDQCIDCCYFSGSESSNAGSARWS